MTHPLFNLAAGILVGAMGVRVAKSLPKRAPRAPSPAMGPNGALSSPGGARNQARGSARSDSSSEERTSASGSRLEDLPDTTEFAVPSASNSAREEPKVRTGRRKTSKALSKTKQGQALA